MKYLDNGNNQKSASKVFGLHRNTISRWWNRQQKEGTFLARARVGAKRKLDLEQLSAFVDKNPDCKLSEIGEHFKISGAWASIMLKKIGYSYKKKRLPTWKRMKRKGMSTWKL